MNIQRPSCVVIVALIATQVLGPAVLWAAEQRGMQIDANRLAVIAAISGDQLTVQNSKGTRALHFREAVNVGDHITTGDHTVAEVLVGNRAVVTLGQNTAVQFTTVSDEQTTLQVNQGLVRVAAAASVLGTHGIMTVQTPTGQVQTRGGIMRVLVDQPASAAEHTPIGESKAYLASYSAGTAVAALTPRSATIQVEEGSADILAGVGGKAMTLQAGQAVTIRSEQVGATSKFVNQAGVRAGVLATAGHSQTSKEGRDHLVALQVEQATALGNALTGAKETGNGEADKKDNGKSAINGATGGVTLSSLVSSLFGGGSTSNPAAGGTTNRSGAGYGGNNNSGFNGVTSASTNVKFNGENALLLFTRKDPVQSIVKEDITITKPFTSTPVSYTKGQICGFSCVLDHDSSNNSGNIGFKPLPSVASQFTVDKELVLIGGTSNDGHGGVAPTETLIVRGAAPTPGLREIEIRFTNRAPVLDPISSVLVSDGPFPTDRAPADTGLVTQPEIRAANSTFVVKTPSRLVDSAVGAGPNFPGGPPGSAYIGGTLGQYSNVATPPPSGIAIDQLGGGVSHVDAAITATGSTVVLTGGVTLDQGTKATIGTTTATNNYYTAMATPADVTRKSTLQSLGATFTGSLVSVIDGPTGSTSVTVQDRLLGVYDGSIIDTESGNKALLSVLDAKLKGPASPIPLIDIAKGQHFPGFNESPDRISTPKVEVTSAVVVRSTMELDGPKPIQLDRALLEASAPLFALTNVGKDPNGRGGMTTTSHFADLAGNKAQSLLLNDTLVALSASTLTINGNLLNLNTATATVNGYLFSLNNGSTLTLNNGALFHVTNGSSLNLNGNAFGVFGSGANTLSIDNNLCTATCFQLVNSANQPIVLPNGTPLHVAGATHNVMLPDTFKVFALAPGAPTPTINIGANDALFTVDGTSTVTINGTKVQ